MTTDSRESFRFEYDPGVIRFGRGCVDSLAGELARQGYERTLVVCGQTVGETPAVIEPVKAGLGDRLADVFAQTTPDKRLETAIEAAERMQEVGADVLVSVGGGSSLDVATVTSVVAASDRSPESLGAEFERTGRIEVPDAPLPPLVAVPTTLAGADLSIMAGVTASPESRLVGKEVSGGVGDPRLMPSALFYDPALFETTPRAILTGSAMNGFDKGIETLYANTATPVTDATAKHGLELLAAALPTLGADRSEWVIEDVVRGIVLVQYGISRPEETTLSLIHAFGHGLTDHSDIQQGAAHAIVAPHALAFLFERVDGRRHLLADALGVSNNCSDEELAAGIVEKVREIRDALDVPTQLRNAEDVERSMFDDIAETTANDYLLEYTPEGLDVTAKELEGVLEAAW